MKKTFLTPALLLCAATVAYAQDVALVTDIVATPNYIVAIISGVIIAFAVQYLLTALSVAIGISATPDLKHKYAELKAQPNDPTRAGHKRWDEMDEKSTPLGVVISTGMGVWNTLTTAIALFAGTSLALTLSPVLTAPIAITLALTIWGLFFMLLFWLESRFASTIVGGLISTATAGIKSLAQGVADLVTPSPMSKAESFADATISKLESSFGGSLDSDRIVEAIQNFGQQINKSVDNAGNQVAKTVDDKLGNVPSYEQLRKDIRNIVQEGAQAGKSNPAKWTAIQSVIQTAIEGSSSSDNAGAGGASKRSQLQDLLKELKANYDQQGGDAVAAFKQTASAKTSLSEEDIDAYVEQVKQTIGSSTSADVDSGALSRKLQDLLQRGGGNSKLLEKLTSIDQETIKQLVANNTSMSKEQVDSFVSKALKAINDLREQLTQGNFQEAMSTVEDATGVHLQESVDQVQAMVTSFLGGGTSTRGSSDSNDGGLDFAGIKRIVTDLISKPDDTIAAVRSRLTNFNADDIVERLPIAANSTAEAKMQLRDTLNTARTEIETRINQLEASAHGTYRQAERRAVIEAEHLRKSAMTAAWWLVISIVVSGLAAVGGALL